MCSAHLQKYALMTPWHPASEILVRDILKQPPSIGILAIATSMIVAVVAAAAHTPSGLSIKGPGKESLHRKRL